MVKKLKQNKLKQKQKQKQKQSVKVSQNVKVILNDLKKKRIIKKKSTGASVNRKQQPNISLNIINPYQQFLPQPLQAQPQPVKQSELNKSNPANPSILRTLGALNNQNTMIQNELRDLREFSKNQQESYNYLLSAQRETPENKIDKMLKNKKRIASSMNWNNIINNENKSEEKIIKEEKDSPNIYPWINQYPNQPPRYVSPRPQAQQNILSSWLTQARENIAQPQQEYQPQQYFSGIPEEEDDDEEYDRYIEGQSMMEEDKQSSLMNEAFKQELEAQKKEGAGAAGVDEPMTVKGSKKINKIIKKQQMLKSIAESKEMEQEDERSNLMREAFKKQIEEGADEEPVKSKRGRKIGSKNRSAEEIQQEKRKKEQNRFIKNLIKRKQIKLKKEKKNI